MAESAEAPHVQVAGVKRPSVDLDGLQRKKFKTEELPLSAAQHAAIDHLLHAFKKKGGFDAIRKKVWAEFEEGVCSTFLTTIPVMVFFFSSSHIAIYDLGANALRF